MHEKKHPELGQAKKIKVAGVPEGFVAGNPAKNPAEGGVADMFKEQPPPVVKPTIFQPKMDKNQKLINKMAIRQRATTAKAQGSFRRTKYGEDGMRFPEKKIGGELKYNIFQTCEPLREDGKTVIGVDGKRQMKKTT